MINIWDLKVKDRGSNSKVWYLKLGTGALKIRFGI